MPCEDVIQANADQLQMISEIIKGKKYQSRAFLLLPMTFNIGVIIGVSLVHHHKTPPRHVRRNAMICKTSTVKCEEGPPSKLLLSILLSKHERHLCRFNQSKILKFDWGDRALVRSSFWCHAKRGVLLTYPRVPIEAVI